MRINNNAQPITNMIPKRILNATTIKIFNGSIGDLSINEKAI